MEARSGASPESVRGWEAIKRGWQKRCPHCGQSPIFIRWMKTHERCQVCGHVFERDYGDTWGVWIVTDRIPLAIGIVAVYFGFRVTTFWIGLLFFCSMTIPLVATMPRRHGVAIALVYLSRRKWPDSNDPMPPQPPAPSPQSMAR